MNVQGFHRISLRHVNHFKLPSTLSRTQRRRNLTIGRYIIQLDHTRLRRLRTVAYAATFCATATALIFLTSHELLERDFPSPHEWSYRTRLAWHTANAMQDAEVSLSKIPQWANAARAFDFVLRRSEDLAIDGHGLLVVGELLQDEEGAKTTMLLDMSKVMDISAKPEPWRRGYIDALMGAALAAEYSENMFRDEKTGIVWHKQYIQSEDNPEPPSVKGFKPPLAENCVPVTPSPRAYYNKVLATVGLSDKQFITASLAYANYLSTSNQQVEALNHIHSAISRSLIPLSQSNGPIVDPRTFALRADGSIASINLLTSLTALAVHHVTTGSPQAALPIFLSVVRAYRSTPLHKPTVYNLPFDPFASNGEPFAQLLWAKTKEFIGVVEYPPAPASGNEPLSLRQVDEDCAEAITTTYAAETLWALAPSQHTTALRWTEDAVSAAGTRSVDMNAKGDERERCRTCAEGAMKNWEGMVLAMGARLAVQKEGRTKDKLEQEVKLEQERLSRAMRKVEVWERLWDSKVGKWKLWRSAPESMLISWY
jgi:hypothetical protein